MNRISDHALTVPGRDAGGVPVPTGDVPEAVEIRHATGVESEELEPSAGAATANGRFTAIQVPSVHHSTRTERSGSRSWIAWQEQRDHEQDRIELRAAPSPRRTPRPSVATRCERRERQRRERDRHEVPVDRAVDQQGRGEREPECAPAGEEPTCQRRWPQAKTVRRTAFV
jgi:hypothetical protein